MTRDGIIFNIRYEGDKIRLIEKRKKETMNELKLLRNKAVITEENIARIKELLNTYSKLVEQKVKIQFDILDLKIMLEKTA